MYMGRVSGTLFNLQLLIGVISGRVCGSVLTLSTKLTPISCTTIVKKKKKNGTYDRLTKTEKLDKN